MTNILNDVQNKNLVLHEKQFCAKTKMFYIAQRVILSRQKQVDVAQNIVSCQKKKFMLHKKSISCWQKQDDSAPKKPFVLKKVTKFCSNGAQ